MFVFIESPVEKMKCYETHIALEDEDQLSLQTSLVSALTSIYLK